MRSVIQRLCEAEGEFRVADLMKGDLCHASVDTRHFSFDAYGRTEQEALAALKNGLLRHVQMQGGEVGTAWVDELMDPANGDVHVTHAKFGSAYRDREFLSYDERMRRPGRRPSERAQELAPDHHDAPEN
jgi:hypothetical protein